MDIKAVFKNPLAGKKFSMPKVNLVRPEWLRLPKISVSKPDLSRFAFRWPIAIFWHENVLTVKVRSTAIDGGVWYIFTPTLTDKTVFLAESVIWIALLSMFIGSWFLPGFYPLEYVVTAIGIAVLKPLANSLYKGEDAPTTFDKVAIGSTPLVGVVLIVTHWFFGTTFIDPIMAMIIWAFVFWVVSTVIKAVALHRSANPDIMILYPLFEDWQENFDFQDEQEELPASAPEPEVILEQSNGEELAPKPMVKQAEVQEETPQLKPEPEAVMSIDEALLQIKRSSGWSGDNLKKMQEIFVKKACEATGTDMEWLIPRIGLWLKQNPKIEGHFTSTVKKFLTENSQPV